MSKQVTHTIILIITIGLSFLFSQSNLSQYDLQITAFLFIAMFLTKKFYLPKYRPSKLLESIVFTFIVITLIQTTGGVHSSLFFLVYFLLFSLSLLLEPLISITASFTLIIFFLFSLPQKQNFNSLLPIFSLAFLTPFALLMAQERDEVQKLKLKDQNSKQETFLFLSLVLKNHLKNIQQAIANFKGDHELQIIRKQTGRMEKLINEFEKEN